MMKWKARKETTNIGVLELGNLTFNEDYMEISIDIFDMSEEMKTEINKAIEIAKERYVEEEKDWIAEHPEHKNKRCLQWSNKPVVMDFTFLRIRLEAGKPIDYSVEIGFHDAVNDSMEQWDCSITVDLSEHTKELQKAIIKVLIDKFF
jgi:hypothetical protein